MICAMISFGSDDYMVKPVNVNEMVLRVGALLRRAQILNEHKIVIGSTEFDYDINDGYN